MTMLALILATALVTILFVAALLLLLWALAELSKFREDR